MLARTAAPSKPALLPLLLLSLFLVGCSDDDADRSLAGLEGGPPPGHSVRLDVTLVPDEDGTTVTFLTPSVSLFSMPASHLAGKPYYVAVFEGGFDQGVDPDLHHEWGTVPEDLHVTYVSPNVFADGPYDVSFIVYTETEITQAMREDYFGIVPKAGELSAFSLSLERVLPGDPVTSNGVVRANVQGSDGEISLLNRHDPADILGSLNDTVLTVP